MDTNPELTPSNAGILQEVNDLSIGSQYQLSFWTQARTLGEGENDLLVSWFDASEEYESHTGASSLIEQTTTLNQGGFDRTWYQYFFTFTATSESMNIAFAGSGDATGKGALLDNISLEMVPEPSMLLVMLISLIGFSSRRKSS